MNKVKTCTLILAASALLFAASGTAFAQVKKRTRPAKKIPAATVPMPSPEKVPTKKNGRPGSYIVESPVAERSITPIFFYEFTRPGFKYSMVKIEHDENGAGTIAFTQDGYDEVITDPIVVSGDSLARINVLLDELDFVNSTEDYQFEKDYSHLGTNRFRIVRGAAERTASFNWTSKKAAKGLADEYRKLSNQYIWVFEINLARENQPLESPRLMNSLESLIKRDEISDPVQMLPFLERLGNDERMPLMARNTAARITASIQKEMLK